jgi:hypothetical protein
MSLLNPPAYSKSLVNDWNNIESVIKHEPPENPVYTTGVVNNWNIIEIGIKHETLEPPAYSKSVINDLILKVA